MTYSAFPEEMTLMVMRSSRCSLSAGVGQPGILVIKTGTRPKKGKEDFGELQEVLCVPIRHIQARLIF